MCFLVVQIRARHHFLQWLITTKAEEDTSYENANYLNVRVSVSMLTLCILEICLYFFYNKRVNNFSRKISYDFMSNIKIFILAAPMGTDSKGSERDGCHEGGDGDGG